jgi:hypothetical protein
MSPVVVLLEVMPAGLSAGETFLFLGKICVAKKEAV